MLVTCLVLLTLLMSSQAAMAASVDQNADVKINSPEAMAVDLLAARPLGLVAMLGGTVVFVVSLPFSALGGNTEDAWNTLVVTPAEYTFHRPLGDFNQQPAAPGN
ncbi:hypothetical protein FCL47_09565 [Desulfopila sp. IMCC35006]|nr:hypothetical protein FCL47_09565 [Desulfopila sp. IMCC35006]